MAKEGWIKLHRKILDSPLYKSLNSKQRDIMIQCLLMANHTDNEWVFNGIPYKCKAGQFYTSLASIHEKCAKDVTIQNIRTCLVLLEKSKFLTSESTKQNRLITITKWASYQDKNNETNKETNKDLTKTQQRSNKDLTTNKNNKEYKEGEKLKEFNTMPTPDMFNGLPDIKAGATIQLIRLTKHTDVSNEQISGLWEVFKIQNLTGSNYYKDEDSVYTHFMNWSKMQGAGIGVVSQPRRDVYVEKTKEQIDKEVEAWLNED